MLWLGEFYMFQPHWLKRLQVPTGPVEASLLTPFHFKRHLRSSAHVVMFYALELLKPESLLKEKKKHQALPL